MIVPSYVQTNAVLAQNRCPWARGRMGSSRSEGIPARGALPLPWGCSTLYRSRSSCDILRAKQRDAPATVALLLLHAKRVSRPRTEHQAYPAAGALGIVVLVVLEPEELPRGERRTESSSRLARTTGRLGPASGARASYPAAPCTLRSSSAFLSRNARPFSAWTTSSTGAMCSSSQATSAPANSSSS